MEFKTCTKCKTQKPVSDYYKRSQAAGGGLDASCKECKKLWYRRDRRWGHLKERYGVSKEQYEEMYTLQNGACGICQSVLPVLAVDHCHQSGKIRGLLCKPCNSAIGLLGDNVQSLKNALNYLENK
jgi:hypothetical protein